MTRTVHRTSTVDSDGRLSLPPLPQAIGKTVSVIILFDDEASVIDRDKAKRLLKGSVIVYDDPFGSAAAPEEWEALS